MSLFHLGFFFSFENILFEFFFFVFFSLEKVRVFKVRPTSVKDGLSYLFHSSRNKYFNKISLGNMLYFQNNL